MNEFLSFRKFVTPLIIQIIFWIGVVHVRAAGLAMIGWSDAGLRPPSSWGCCSESSYSRSARCWCASGAELLILLFKIYDELVAIRTGKMPEGRARSP
jgi:hypothetical protein